MARRKSPEVNAGSMADIAFLLLIFFLVTTTIETDSGINRKLPPMEEQIDPPIIRQKNIFTVVVNKNNQLLVEEELTDIKQLRSLAVDFLDNGGGSGEEFCDYCQGDRDPRSSDNPEKAIISLTSSLVMIFSKILILFNKTGYSKPSTLFSSLRLNSEFQTSNDFG